MSIIHQYKNNIGIEYASFRPNDSDVLVTSPLIVELLYRELLR